MKTNYHTHTTWCDGSASVEEMTLAAIEKGFDKIGFSSHAMLPGEPMDWTLTAAKIVPYAEEVRALAAKYAGRIRVLCGVEADYVKGLCSADRSTYAAIRPDYVIGSVHCLIAPDGAFTCVDESPESFMRYALENFGGVEPFVRGYFAAEREMVATCDFDIVAHPDLCRKFNAKLKCFDENAAWYRDELERTADAIAASGKVVEINTGAISRGWLADAYPALPFYEMLKARGVRFILSSDAHSPSALDCAFDRYADRADFQF